MVLVGVILSVGLVLVVLKWWSEGMFEASDAFLLVVVFGGLLFGLFAAQTPWQFALAFVPLVLTGSYLFYSYTTGGMKAYYRRQCREFIAAIESDPRNLAAREYLADSLYYLGELDRSIDELQAAVDLGAGTECQYKLKKWQQERHLHESLNPVCKWCRTENQPGSRTCSRCGSELPFQSSFGRWLTGGQSSTARYYLLFVFGLALVCVSLAVLPLRFAFIPVGLFAAALIGWSLIASAR